MPRNRRPIERDARDFDTTSLHAGFHGKILHRDYTAHFFRWNFARRFIKPTDDVLEVGCGPETPLMHILFHNSFPYASSYLGIDLNKLPTINHARAELKGETNFCRDYKKILKAGDYSIAVHMEVIEHMKVEHGRQLLRGCFYALRPGGTMLMSTPCYDGRRHAANHIHEYTVPELKHEVQRAGFEVAHRYGTFMDIKNVRKVARQMNEHGMEIETVYDLLEPYYDNDALSCFFAPMFPDHARNNLWVCRKPTK